MDVNVALFCLIVFVCRIVDMFLASVRTVYTVKGKSLTAAGISIIEGLIYFLVVKEALNFSSENFAQTLDIAFAYSCGFAVGTLIGSIVGNKLAGGMVQAQVVMTTKDDEKIKKIQDAGYAITILKSEATTFSGEKYMLFSELKSNKLKEFRKLIHSLDEKAFVMVNETKYVYNGFIKK